MLSTALDRDIFHTLLKTIRRNGPPGDLGELLLSVGSFFLGTPYAAGTLEQEGLEDLVINLRQMDCFTFLENTVVLTRLIRAGRDTWADFEQALSASRYRRGVPEGFASRLHYFTDWLYENQRRGILQDITPALGGELFRKKIDFMTAHRDQYPPLKAADSYAQLVQVEKNCTARRHYYIPKRQLPPVIEKISNGDLIAIATDIDGLDVVHVGLALHQNRGFHLLHSSRLAGKVVISEATIYRYLQQRKLRVGIMVARVL